MHLMILENRRLINTVRPDAGMVAIGSNPQCQVHLPDPRIVPHLANLSQDGAGEWWLEILDASIPTCLNRAVQKVRAKLRHGDEITVAHYAIRLFMESGKSREEIQRQRLLALTRAHEASLGLDSIVHRSIDEVVVAKEQLEQITLLVQRLEHAASGAQLMQPILRAVLRSFEGRRAWIGIRRTDRTPFDWTMGLTDRGQPCERPPFSESMEARCLEQTQYVCSPAAPQAGVRSAMGVPLVCQGGNLGMLYVENDSSDPAYDEAALHTLSAMACCIARPIENFIAQTATRKQAVASTEQTIARATQDALTPKALPHWNDLQIAAYRFMGAARCCDFYDVVQLADKTAWLVVARVCADALATPRYLAEVRAAFRSAALHTDAPHLFARALNWALFTGEGRASVHLVGLWLVPGSGKVQYVSAGDGVILRRIAEDGESHAPASPPAPAIAQTRTPGYESHLLELGRGESLMIATSGADAARNAAGEAFGLSSLERSICDGVGQPPGGVLGEFEADLKEFLAGGSCPEDITIVLARRP